MSDERISHPNQIVAAIVAAFEAQVAGHATTHPADHAALLADPAVLAFVRTLVTQAARNVAGPLWSELTYDE